MLARRAPSALFKGTLTAIVAAALGLLSACSTATASSSLGASAKLVVATTVAPLTNIAANIGGDLVTIRGIVPEGTNSHTFEPPPSAAKNLAQADIVIVNGLGLEDPTRQLAEGNRKAGAETLTLGDKALSPDQYLFDFPFPKAAGKPNPHLWTDPTQVKRYAELIADAFSRRDPAHAANFAANRDAYLAKVDQLDRALRTATETLAPSARKLLTYHDAYAYFARSYGWQVIGAIQPADFEEPTAKDVGALIDQIKSEQVKAIFGSEVFPSPVLKQIAAESGASYVDNLRDDDLPGKPGAKDHSLLELLRFNFTTMVSALGGDATALRAVDTSNLNDRAEYPQ